MRWLPLLGCLALIGVLVWRPWLHRRRYGGTSVLFLRSGDWRQKARDAIGVGAAFLFGGQALTYAFRKEPLALLFAPNAATNLSGAALQFGGIALLIASQLDLGRSWRMGIDEHAKPGLVTGGLYRYTRNPIYLGIFVTIAGYALLLPTMLSLLLWIGVLIGFRQQVLLEEKYLTRTYGEEFRAYAARVGRFLPGIGRLPS
ncbi:MAG: isoprenylcysteine carboxylmethyltransferase family protein [Alphaproteobacteria bacterium]|nr:isoprenylcysteine carboxylmethyltransferase family protein [Alphaproteobacteria bacterium]